MKKMMRWSLHRSDDGYIKGGEESRIEDCSDQGEESPQRTLPQTR